MVFGHVVTFFGGMMVRASDPESGKRVKRLLQLVFLLQASEPRSSDQLAKRFKVSRRTIFRDIQLLREAGIPVTPGSKGTGYCLRTNDMRCVQLQPLELIAVASIDEPAISSLGFLRQAREIALAKLANSTATFSKAQVQFVLQRLAEVQVNGKPDLREEAIESLAESWIKAAQRLMEK